MRPSAVAERATAERTPKPECRRIASGGKGVLGHRARNKQETRPEAIERRHGKEVEDTEEKVQQKHDADSGF